MKTQSVLIVHSRLALAVMVILAGFAAAFQTPRVAHAGGTFVVNSSSDVEGPDNVLTLPEAIFVANGPGRGFTTAEKNQLGGCTWDYDSLFNVWDIIGGCGGGVFDRITFDPSVTEVDLTAPLRPILGDGTWIDGTTVRPRIDGSGMSAGNALTVDASHVTISNLEIVNTPRGTDPSARWAAITIRSGRDARIAYNYIGTVAGAIDCAPAGVTRNADIGVYVAPNTTGGSGAGNGTVYIYGNTIGCFQFGVLVKGADWAYVGQTPDGQPRGNFIGVNTAGSHLPNGEAGVALDVAVSNAVRNSTICDNTIAFGYYGVYLRGNGLHSSSGSWLNTIRGNRIHHNAGAGIRLEQAASFTTIGSASLPPVAADRNYIYQNGHVGIEVNGSNSSLINGNYIGTDPTGAGAAGNGVAGVWLNRGSASNAIRNNVVGGNGQAGVWLQGATATTVKGNLIGTDAAASAAIPNGQEGVRLTDAASSNAVGGSAPGERNVISGNTGSGIALRDVGTSGNSIEGNLIGLNAVGTGALPNVNGVLIAGGASSNRVVSNRILFNRNLGVWLTGSTTWSNAVQGNTIRRQGNTGVQIDDGAYSNLIGPPIGGPTTLGNVISGNVREGVYIAGAGTRNNTLFSNAIGTTAKGLSSDGNGLNGVYITDGAYDNWVGDGPNERNLIGGNGRDGVVITNGAHDNRVQGNFIGVSATGTAALPNLSGVAISGASNNIIGGDTPDRRNLLSGNRAFGVYLGGASTTGNRVDFNLIGTDASGLAALPNALAGVGVVGVPGRNVVGSSVAGVTQFISGNTREGIFVQNTAGTLVGRSNRIGLAADGKNPLGNGRQGVLLDGATGTRVLAQAIAYNWSAGVAVVGAGARSNRLQPIEVLGNGGLPIDLGNDGPTANDAGDTDGGPNVLLNYPVITGGSGSTVGGTACAGCTVLIYRATGNPRAAGGGGSYLRAATTSSSGAWSVMLPAGVTRADIALVAVDANANTSEMSPRQ